MGRLSGWLRRKSHTITAGVGASDHYQIPFKVYKGNGTDGTETWGTYTLHKVYCGGNCRDDFGDIRFTDDDGTTLLDYWIDDKNFISGTSAIIWVEVIDDLSSNQSIYIYYDNPSATSVSSIENTFLVPADEFTGNNGDAPNPDKWTSSPSPYATIQDNTLRHYFPDSSHKACDTEATISPTFPIEICFKWKTTKLQLTLSNVVFCIYNSNPWWSIYYRDYGVYIYTRSGGNWGSRASTGVLAINTWYDFRIRVTSTSITVEIRKQSDNSLFWSSPTCAMDTLGVPFRQALYSYTYTWVTYHYYENFRMRKFTSTEPSSGAWGGQETELVLLEVLGMVESKSSTITTVVVKPEGGAKRRYFNIFETVPLSVTSIITSQEKITSTYLSAFYNEIEMMRKLKSNHISNVILKPVRLTSGSMSAPLTLIIEVDFNTVYNYLQKMKSEHEEWNKRKAKGRKVIDSIKDIVNRITGF